jgi:phosphoribosylglycinamide formyltransferase-1
MGKLQIGVLVSGSGSNLQAIMDACKSGAINGEVVVVGSDKAGVYGLERAEKAGIPTFVVDYRAVRKEWSDGARKVPRDYSQSECRKKVGARVFNRVDPNFFQMRAMAEEELLHQLAPYNLDLLVLAGYMKILTPYFIDRFNTDPDKPKIMNIHPALLPSFPGEHGYEDTYFHGCKVGGCTVHFVDYGEDTGPIIGQKAYAIEPGDDLESIKEKGLALEWKLYPECIQLFAEGRLVVKTNEKGIKIVETLPEFNNAA